MDRADFATMLAIVGGLGAAICWATSAMGSARSSRRIGAWSTVAWVMLVGTILTLPILVVGGTDAVFTPTMTVLLVVAGISNVVGLLLVYSAFRLGKVAVVAPIVSTEGAMAAIIAIILGENVAIPVILTLTTIAFGVMLAASDPGPQNPATVEPGALSSADADSPDGVTRDAPVDPAAGAAFVADIRTTRTALLTLAAALTFGINLYASARIGTEVSIIWSIVPARVAGTVGLALPLFLLGRLRMTRAAVPYVLIVAVAEVVGMAAFAFGARDGIAIASVMSSQFGAIAAIASVALFGETIRRRQVIGTAVIAAGVAMLAALQAG